MKNREGKLGKKIGKKGKAHREELKKVGKENQGRNISKKCEKGKAHREELRVKI